MEYRYWSFLESHPAHAPLAPESRAEAMDALTWSYTGSLRFRTQAFYMCSYTSTLRLSPSIIQTNSSTLHATRVPGAYGTTPFVRRQLENRISRPDASRSSCSTSGRYVSFTTLLIIITHCTISAMAPILLPSKQTAPSRRY